VLVLLLAFESGSRGYSRRSVTSSHTYHMHEAQGL
jgi:hypothetical protein